MTVAPVMDSPRSVTFTMDMETLRQTAVLMLGTVANPVDPAVSTVTLLNATVTFTESRAPNSRPARNTVSCTRIVAFRSERSANVNWPVKTHRSIRNSECERPASPIVPDLTSSRQYTVAEVAVGMNSDSNAINDATVTYMPEDPNAKLLSNGKGPISRADLQKMAIGSNTNAKIR